MRRRSPPAAPRRLPRRDASTSARVPSSWNRARLSGAEILYLGRPPLRRRSRQQGDASVATGLILREMESEVQAMEKRGIDAQLKELMARKTDLDSHLAQLRLARQRASTSTGPCQRRRPHRLESSDPQPHRPRAGAGMRRSPPGQGLRHDGNPPWGPLNARGNDKSLFAAR